MMMVEGSSKYWSVSGVWVFSRRFWAALQTLIIKLLEIVLGLVIWLWIHDWSWQCNVEKLALVKLEMSWATFLNLKWSNCLIKIVKKKLKQDVDQGNFINQTNYKNQSLQQNGE